MNETLLECEDCENEGLVKIEERDYEVMCYNCGTEYIVKSNGEVIKKDE